MNRTKSKVTRLISDCRLNSELSQRHNIVRLAHSETRRWYSKSRCATHLLVSSPAKKSIIIGDHPKHARLISTQYNRTVKNRDARPGKIEQDIVVKTDHILHNVGLGSLDLQQISYAKYLIRFYSQRHTLESVNISEEVLERLISEGRDGGNPGATVENKLYNMIIDAYAKSNSNDGAYKAEALLKRMYERFENRNKDADNELIPAEPDITSYNTLLNAWCRNRSEEAVGKAEEIMTFLESEESPNPVDVTYNIMMNTYANQVGEYGYSQKAEDILLLMASLQKDGDFSINPDTLSFNTVLKAWKNSGGGVESAHRAEDLLRLMCKMYSDGHPDVKPDTISFSTVIHAYTNYAIDGNIPPDILDRLENIANLILDSKTNLAASKDSFLKPLNKIIECIGKSDVDNASDRANRILEKMVSAKDSGISHHGPDSMTYAHIMKICLNNKKTAQKARDMLQNMFDGSFPVIPTTRCVNTILHYHCKENDTNNAERLFKEMSNVAETRKFRTLPDAATYNMMANLYFRSNERNSFEKILDILSQTKQAFQAKILPNLDPFVFEITFRKLLNSSNIKTRRRALDVLLEMVHRHEKGDLREKPRTVMFNMVLSTLTRERSKEAADIALNLLQIMERGCNQNGKGAPPPDIITYSHVLVALIRAMNKDTAERIVSIVDKIDQNNVELDNAVFETALQGLSHQEHGNSKLAYKTIKKMQHLEDGKHGKVRVNSDCLNLLLRSICNEKKLAKGEMATFNAHNYLIDCVASYDVAKTSALPSKIGFNTVLNSWAQSGHWKGVSKAEEIYKIMERLSNEGHKNADPDPITASIMLRIYTQKISSKKVQKRALDFFYRQEIDDLDTFACNSFLTLLARSKVEDRVTKARALLKRMEEKGLANVVSYNTMINVCAFSEGTKENLSTALEAFREAPTKNEMTFFLAMKACNNLSTDKVDKESNLKILFNGARESGFLGKRVVNEIKFGIQSDKAREALLGVSLVGNLEESWRRNVGR